MADAYSNLLIERHADGYAVVTLNRPEALNALNAALFKDLAYYGVRPPKQWGDAGKAIDHMSHQVMLGLYQWNFGTAFHTDMPSEDDMAW